MSTARSIASALAVLASALAACGPGDAGRGAGLDASDDRPSIVLYLIDTLRADHLGAYGYARATSPYLDALAARGVLFEAANAQDSRTLGSVVSLLTSLHTPSHGIVQFGQRISPEVVTLAQALRDAGYETGSFVTNVNAGTLPGLDRGFGHFHDAIKTLRDPGALRSLPEEALFAWIDGVRGKPFFAYVHTAEPHRPYTPPAPYSKMFDPDYRGPIDGSYEGPRGYASATDPADVAHVAALYDGEIRFADDALRRLLDGLAVRGQGARTLVVVTADHGEELRDRGGWHHGHTLYDELIRVPLVFAGPGVPAGRRIAAPVQLVDVAPTLLEIARAPRPRGFEGESLWGLIRGAEGAPGAERESFSMMTQSPQRIALVRGRWKAILGPDDALELYDLASDPGERSDLAAREPERAASFRARIGEWRQSRTRGSAPPSLPLERDDEAELRALGYVE